VLIPFLQGSRGGGEEKEKERQGDEWGGWDGMG
jgi:hypothetical protein